MRPSFCSWPRFLPLAMSAALLACSPDGSRDGSADSAMSQNEERINQADVTERQEDDAAFLVEFTGNTLLNMELGKLAQARGHTPIVRSFGARLVQQEMELIRDVRSLASAKGLALPTELSDDQQAAYHEVSTLSGTVLDKRLLQLVIKTHSQDEDALDDMRDEAYDGDIRGLAAKYLPVVREQLAATEEIDEEIDDLP